MFLISFYIKKEIEENKMFLWNTNALKTPSFEKYDPDIWSWPLQMTLTLVPGDVYRKDVPSYRIWAM